MAAPTGCSFVAGNFLECAYFNPLEVLSKSIYTLQTIELAIHEDGMIFHYSTDIWPALRILHTNSGSLVCEFGVCSNQLSDPGLSHSNQLSYSGVTLPGNTTHFSDVISGNELNHPGLPPSDVNISMDPTVLGLFIFAALAILLCLLYYSFLFMRRSRVKLIDVGPIIDSSLSIQRDSPNSSDLIDFSPSVEEVHNIVDIPHVNTPQDISIEMNDPTSYVDDDNDVVVVVKITGPTTSKRDQPASIQGDFPTLSDFTPQLMNTLKVKPIIMNEPLPSVEWSGGARPKVKQDIDTLCDSSTPDHLSSSLISIGQITDPTISERQSSTSIQRGSPNFSDFIPQHASSPKGNPLLPVEQDSDDETEEKEVIGVLCNPITPIIIQGELPSFSEVLSDHLTDPILGTSSGSELTELYRTAEGFQSGEIEFRSGTESYDFNISSLNAWSASRSNLTESYPIAEEIQSAEIEFRSGTESYDFSISRLGDFNEPK